MGYDETFKLDNADDDCFHFVFRTFINADITYVQAKEYLANPEAFAVAVAPTTSEATAEVTKVEEKVEENDEDSDDMVSINQPPS